VLYVVRLLFGLSKFSMYIGKSS